MSQPILDDTTGEVLGVDDVDELEAADIETLRRLAGAYRQQAAGLKVDVDRLEREGRNYRRKIASLEAELDEQMQNAPETATIKTIFHAWVSATGRNPKTAKLGPARHKAVLARMREGHDHERILRAATIGAKAAHVSDKEAERLALLAALQLATKRLAPEDAQAVRSTYKSGLGRTQVYDDLELICRNEVNLERFANLADSIDPIVAMPGVSGD
jgi:hypothetical protein